MNSQQFFRYQLPVSVASCQLLGNVSAYRRVGVNGALEWWSTGVVEYWGQPSAFFFHRARPRYRLFVQLTTGTDN
jgi:hypothetical protein